MGIGSPWRTKRSQLWRPNSARSRAAKVGLPSILPSHFEDWVANVGLLALSVDPSIRTRLASLGIAVQSRSVRTQSPAFQARLLTRWNTAGQALASMAASSRAPSWYVVISDEAVDFARHLSDRTCAYLSNGDLSLLAFSYVVLQN